MPSASSVADVVAALEELYPPESADPGDPVGLVVGDPAAPVRRVLFAVDPVQAVAEEAVGRQADLLVVHHPLLFRAVHSVAATSPKGRVVHRLARNGIALVTAHTNADGAADGVSESLARALGLEDVRPLVPAPAEPLDKVVTFVPAPDVDSVVDALTEAGAGTIGAYDRCAFVASGQGTFRPGAGASPVIGEVGRIEVVDERRVEMVLPRHQRGDIVAALRRAHPYEEPAFDVFELTGWPSRHGHGRVGRLAEPLTLRDFARRIAATLPPSAAGVRVAGDPGAVVETVAVVGGAGDSFLNTARTAGVDAYLTSDLRHHPASEAREHPRAPALLDVSHWAAEWTWLPVAATALTGRLAEREQTVDCSVSTLCTDPWTFAVPSSARSST